MKSNVESKLKALIEEVEFLLQERRAALSSASILQKQKAVLRNENTRLFQKIDELTRLGSEQEAYIEFLETEIKVLNNKIPTRSQGPEGSNLEPGPKEEEAYFKEVKEARLQWNKSPRESE